MTDEIQRIPSSEADDDFIVFAVAGERRVVGEFHCAVCGYGIISRGTLPACPMCQGTTWDESPWRPFGRRAGR